MEDTYNGTLGRTFDDHNQLDIPTEIRVCLMGEIIESLILPIYPEGRYQFTGKENLLYIEGSEGKWRAYAREGAAFCINDKEYRKVALQDKAMTILRQGGAYFFLYCEYVNRESQIYHNYFTGEKERICIGKNPANDLIYYNHLISDLSFVLERKENGWEICDCKDGLFLYVNGQRNGVKFLNPGDKLSFLGLHMIAGYHFFSITDGNKRVHTHKESLRRVIFPYDLMSGKESKVEKAGQLFVNRLPRRRLPMKPKEIRFEAPPMSLNNDQIPLMLRMGGSMVSSGRAMFMGNITSMISSVLFPILNSRYTEKQKKEYEERRQEKYNHYLSEKEKEIQIEKSKEEQYLCYNYPSINQVLDFPDSRLRLWERRNQDDDFLTIPIGYGQIPLQAEYNYQKERFQLDEDELEKKMYGMINREVFLEDVPILHSFLEEPICGVVGSDKQKISFVRNVLTQIVMTHSYDEVKLCILTSDEIVDEFPYIRYLPHVWDDGKTVRFLATDPSEGYALNDYLHNILGEDLKKGEELKKILKKRPFYLVIAFDKKIYDSVDILKDVVRCEKNVGVGILTAFPETPKDCMKIFDLSEKDLHRMIHIKDIEQEDIFFSLDACDPIKEWKSMKTLANLYLKVIQDGYTLPKTVTFLEMFQVGKVEHLNPLERWKNSNPMKSLAAPIGVGTDGSLFTLDLHQKAQGPHGLIAGMTGSGKSEFIITYILSLAVNYHPDEVAFLLIDYKGGGLADAFEDKERGIRLPHLLGTITNLDGSMISRSLLAIESEMVRRQQIFKEVKSKTGESSIDIYSYQSLYRNKVLEKPMPHLFIIADEFAEMKQQEPEFIEKLISIARIGRSLGVHLILATQKPSGVVNEQIRSNTKFRICLKVQDKMDSMDMLKRPEAAALKDTGRFYLQVGYDEYFAMGQSAWAGAEYEPQETVVHHKDASVQFLDVMGQSVLTIRKEEKTKGTGKSQLTEIVSYLSELAERNGIESRYLWLDPLPKKLELKKAPIDKIAIKDLPIPLGVLDDPAHQRQTPAYLCLRKMQHTWIVGKTGSGKTTLLHNILQYSMENYKESEVQFYLIDSAGQGLEIYQDTPYCGVVIQEENLGKLKAFEELMQGIIQKRKKLFAKYGLTRYEDAVCSEAACKLPLILVCIDNAGALKTSKVGEEYFYHLADQIRSSTDYGIRYMIFTDHLNELTARIKQELPNRIALQLKDRYEYDDVLGIRTKCLPEQWPGRGMMVREKEGLTLQVCMEHPWLSAEERYQEYREKIEKCKEQGDYSWTKKFSSLDETETYADFCKKFSSGRIPLGYNLQSMKSVALPLRQFSTLPVYFGNALGVEEILSNFLDVASVQGMTIHLLEAKTSRMKGIEKGESIRKIACKEEELITYLSELTNELQERRAIYLAFCAQNNLVPGLIRSGLAAHSYMEEQTRPILIVIERFADFMSLMESQTSSITQIFQIAKRCNVYFIGGFYPRDAEKLWGNIAYKRFLQDEMTLLFGGCFDQAGLVQGMSPEFFNIKKELLYNRFAFQYRGNMYSMQMPCGTLQSAYLHEDDKPVV